MKIEAVVKPGTVRDKVEKISCGRYKIYVKERARGGKANKKLISLLAKKFKVPKKNIKIKNPISRKKVIEVAGKNEV